MMTPQPNHAADRSADAVTIYVEKRPEYEDAARGEGRRLADLLSIPELTTLRRVLRYDVAGVPAAVLPTVIETILSDPITDIATTEPPCSTECRAFAVEYVPGQFDQRADSAAQAIEIVTAGRRPVLRVSQIYILSDDVPKEAVPRVIDQVVNAVDSRVCEPFGPAYFHTETRVPTAVSRVDRFFEIASAPDGVTRLGLAMSPADLAACRHYFEETEGRLPTETELRVLDTYWSDHCRHTTFETALSSITISASVPAAERIRRAHERFFALRRELFSLERSTAPPTLMELATIAARAARASGALDDLLVSEEVNAATVSITVNDTPWYLLFKNETHNHPTEIEPIGGAETCLGGAIRDPLSGRAYVHQAMRVTGSADPRKPLSATRPGKLPQRTITTQAARGFSSYGNQIGLATGVVHEYYHPGYEAKRMEIGAVIGAAPADQVHHRVPKPGDVVLLVGGRTGRDGCGGATGSSKAHHAASITEASAEVQKGNPPVERALQRLFRDPTFSRRIKRANDFGAGGVSVAVGEIAESLDIDLDAVPVKYDGLDGTELAISESQERMAIVVAPEDLEAVTTAAEMENLEATQIAKVTDSGRLVMRWRGQTIVDIARSFLDTNGAPRETAVTVSAGNGPNAGGAGAGQRDSFDLRNPDAWIKRLGDLDAASRKGMSEIFDSTIGAATVLAPWGGRYQLTPTPVAVARVADSATVSMMSYGFFLDASTRSPFLGAYWSVVESVGRLVCAGARRREIRLSFQEYFPRTGDDPVRWGLPYAALLGALEAQTVLGTPAIGGKDSMSGSFEELDVPPTLVSFSFCAGDEERVVGPELQPVNGPIALLIPGIDDVSRVLDLVETLIDRRVDALDRHQDKAGGHVDATNPEPGTLLAAGTIGESGVAAAVATAAFGNWCSLDLDPDALETARDMTGGFAPGTEAAEERDDRGTEADAQRTDRNAAGAAPGTEADARPTDSNAASIARGTEAAVYLQFAGSVPSEVADDPACIVIGAVRRDDTNATLPADRYGPNGPESLRARILIGEAVVSLARLRDAWFEPLRLLFPLDAAGAAPGSPTVPGATPGGPGVSPTPASQGSPTVPSSPAVPGATPDGPGVSHTPASQGSPAVPGAPNTPQTSGDATSATVGENAVSRSRPRQTMARVASPRVCIPVFPGTNCEYDSERAFRDAGAEVATPVFRTLSPEDRAASIADLAREIRRSQILMFPGGFSAGDEPDGSGKYIAAVFAHAELKDALADLIDRRDGLVLGICNGFQALVRMGLLPDGLPGLGAPPRVGLFLNASLHHISTFVSTRVSRTTSPWLLGTDPAQVYSVPVSHGEGRLIADDATIASLTAAGQIATQYVEYNPNGSRDAIEGITSPDGRIFGKMAHNERVRSGLYRNLPAVADMGIFENGVAYFR